MDPKKYPLLISLLLITLLSIISYALLLPSLGFYGDDFFFGYVGHFYGASGLINSLIIDRPLNGYLLAFLYTFIGNNVLLWHIYTFLIRLLGGYFLFYILYKLYPKKILVVTSITLLFLIYPGFLQQTSPLGYSVWITNLTLWILSLVFTIFAIKGKNKFNLVLFSVLSLALQVHSFLQAEFFIGLEVLRILIITLVITNKVSFNGIKKTFFYWGPYVISICIFTLWRIFIFKSTRSVTDINWVAQTYYSNPYWIAKIPLEIILGFFQTTFFSYFVPLFVNIIRLPLEKLLVSIPLGIISAMFFYSLYKKTKDINSTKNFGHHLIVIGFVSIVAAIIPIIISGRFIRLHSTYDRYTITSILGVSFLAVGFIMSRFSYYNKGRYLLTILVFLSITSHLMNGFYHIDYWNKQKDLWWQLYWRAPKIENNAMLVMDFSPVTKAGLFQDIINKVQWYRFYWVDYQIWAAGNLFFNYNYPPKIHFNGDFLADKNIIGKIKNGTDESIIDRNIPLTKNFKNTVIVSVPSDTSCLWVMDKNRNEFPSYASELLKSSKEYSDPYKLIQKESTPIRPPELIFGEEPTHNWCYYFQKASLARQMGNMSKLSELKNEVIQKNLKPTDPNEWLVFNTQIK